MCECGGSMCDDVSLSIQDFNISEEQTCTHDSGNFGGGGMGMGPEEGGGDGDTEEWEDDGWGTFEEQDESKDTIPSSGADFFDTLEVNVQKKKANEDIFERLGVGVGGGGGKGEKRPSPPPVSANLFGSSTGGEGREGGSGGGRGKVDEEAGDWGDWGTSFTSTQAQVHMHIHAHVDTVLHCREVFKCLQLSLCLMAYH